ncbi:unnamed protein product [Darwinula stevensoni]|uniref:PH domain-containing protein n=1 Tax=Darwinula stevensoni TaxID=69355 RepID=A0A7R8X108_9CRUS|nr:unnamed protein product [Darwinula stevensoni]CAG0879710.1 unnamed protein product [Darwinula stevensoni]
MVMEVVYQGWLVKSPPPPKTRVFKAKWRRRWFVLRQSGALPGQYVLEYFTDETCKKIKGHIDLDQCEQVDAGLTFGKYKFMFDIYTPQRVYYLAASSENEMSRWVECLCKVCGLRASQDEEFFRNGPSISSGEVWMSANGNMLPPGTPTSPSSPLDMPFYGPYIPISECVTGKVPIEEPSMILSPSQELARTPLSSTHHRDLPSRMRDLSSSKPIPSVNWDTYPDELVQSLAAESRLGDLNVSESQHDQSSSSLVSGTSTASHRQNDQEAEDGNGASVEPMLQLTLASHVKNPSPQVFLYEFSKSDESQNQKRERFLRDGPPSVNRNLKPPARKHAESGGSPMTPTEASPGIVGQPPPRVDRSLKPQRNPSSSSHKQEFKLGPPPPGRGQWQKTPRAAPSPSPPSMLTHSAATLPRMRRFSTDSDDGPMTIPSSRNQDDEQIFYYCQGGRFIPSPRGRREQSPASSSWGRQQEIQYLDLDLENMATTPKPPEKSPISTTVYKTVDFLKTEAFNKTREDVEASYRKEQESVLSG